MSISGISSASSTSATGTSASATASNGFGSLTSKDFLKLLITELQNQDPTQPTSNAELLQQLSSMQGLQSNLDLSKTLTALSANQQLSSGASFLGKSITGTDASNNSVTGVADRVLVQNGSTVIGVGNSEIPLANVTGVNVVAP